MLEISISIVIFLKNYISACNIFSLLASCWNSSLKNSQIFEIYLRGGILVEVAPPPFIHEALAAVHYARFYDFLQIRMNAFFCS